MRKKKGLTIVERAIIAVPEFENVQKRLAMELFFKENRNKIKPSFFRVLALYCLNCRVLAYF